MHVIFNPDNLTLDLYYQSGQGISYFVGLEPYQRGYGYIVTRQRGGGIGSVFKGLWRYLLPLVKASGAAVGQEGLATASRILSNITHGTNLKDAVINETAEGVKNLADKATQQGAQKTKVMVDQIKSDLLQKGSGRKRKAKSKISYNKISLIGRRVPSIVLKNKRKDSLGYY